MECARFASIVVGDAIERTVAEFQKGDGSRCTGKGSSRGSECFSHLIDVGADRGSFPLAADVAAGTGRAPTPPRKITPPSVTRKERPSTPPRQSFLTKEQPSTPTRQSVLQRDRSPTPPRQSAVARKDRSVTPPKNQRSGTASRSSTPPRVSASQPQSAFTTALAAASVPSFNRRFSWRENVAQNKHSARLTKPERLCRSSSEGSLRKPSSANLSRGARTGATPPPKGRAHRDTLDKGLTLMERIGAPSSSSTSGVNETRSTSSPSRSGFGLTSHGSPSKALDGGQDLYQQVSSLVEELEAARAQANASGGPPPKALEAAASALEPLLRLRDVTGAFSCDLTLMPWLPQLLAVFRNVLHSAVEGPGAPPRSSPPCQLTSADLGAGGFAAPNVEHDTKGDSGGYEFLGLAGLAQAAVLLELEALRAHKRQQDEALRDSQQKERELQEEVEALKARQKELVQQVESAEGRAVAARQAARNAEAVARDAALDAAEMASPRGSTLPAHALVRRVAGLERESCRWESEKRSVEERLAELTSLVKAAVEKDIETRPRSNSHSSPSRTSLSSPTRASAAAIKQRYVDQMARVYAGRNESDVSGGV